MTRDIVEHHAKAPSALVFMARAFLPSPGLGPDGSVPSIMQRWEGVRIDSGHLASFRRACGAAGEDEAGVLYPHVLGFRLQMALLTHRAFPLPVWGALQIRNRLVQHRSLSSGERFDLETRVGANRVVESGVEIDLCSRLVRGPDCAWESVVTYYFRGRFGLASRASPPPAPDLTRALVVERFSMPRGGGWHFGTLTGDYNGIHWSNGYARRFGFPAAFPHPQRVANLCLARLQRPASEKQTLRLWIKGPLFYGAEVVLKATAGPGKVEFGLSLEGDSRPALSGCWQDGDGLDST